MLCFCFQLLRFGTVPRFHRELLAPRPPAVNIKSALAWRLRGCERPRPCRTERSPSLTRAPLLSPESQMRVRPCWAIHHPPSGSRKDLGGGRARSPRSHLFCVSSGFTVSAVDCRLPRGKTTRQSCLLVSAPSCGSCGVSHKTTASRDMMNARNTGGAAVNRVLIYFGTTVQSIRLSNVCNSGVRNLSAEGKLLASIIWQRGGVGWEPPRAALTCLLFGVFDERARGKEMVDFLEILVKVGVKAPDRRFAPA